MKFAIIFAVICASAALIGEAEAQCDYACGAVYKPVCAETATGSRETFPSECSMEIEACKNPSKELKIVKQDAC